MKLFDVMTNDSYWDMNILYLIITASSVNKIKYAFANGNCWNEIMKKNRIHSASSWKTSSER